MWTRFTTDGAPVIEGEPYVAIYVEADMAEARNVVNNTVGRLTLGSRVPESCGCCYVDTPGARAMAFDSLDAATLSARRRLDVDDVELPVMALAVYCMGHDMLIIPAREIAPADRVAKAKKRKRK